MLKVMGSISTKTGRAARVDDAVGRGDEAERRGDDLVARADAVGKQGDVQGRGPAAGGDGVFDAAHGGKGLLKGNDARALGEHARVQHLQDGGLFLLTDQGFGDGDQGDLPFM